MQIFVSGPIVNNCPRKGEYVTIPWESPYPPQVGFDCLYDKEDIIVKVDAIDYGNGVKTIPLQGQEYESYVPAVTGNSLPANTNSELAVVEQTTSTAAEVYEESVSIEDTEKYGDFVEGVFREVTEEVISDDEDDDEFMMFKPVPMAYIINENGYLVRHENEMTPRETLKVAVWDDTYLLGVAEVNYKEVITPKFNVTLDMRIEEIDDFLRPLVTIFRTSPQELLDITSKENGKVIIYGQLCLIEFLASLAGVKITSIDLVSICTVPANYRVFVRVESGGTEEFPVYTPMNDYVSDSEIIFNVLDSADKLLEKIVFLSSKEYKTEELMYIFMCALDRYKTFYICNNNLYVPPWSGNVSTDVWLPVFRELTLAFYGKVNRTKLYDAIKKANMLNNTKVPAAAFLCPVEFLMASGMEAIIMYIPKLFAKQRPLTEGYNDKLLQIKKLKDFATLFDIVEELPNSSNPYPISTIGLFANEMQDVSMYRQLAGCEDTILMQQLIQEFTQVMYRKNPKALAAILTAHRQDLNDKQKEKAVNVLKKNI